MTVVLLMIYLCNNGILEQIENMVCGYYSSA